MFNVSTLVSQLIATIGSIIAVLLADLVRRAVQNQLDLKSKFGHLRQSIQVTLELYAPLYSSPIHESKDTNRYLVKKYDDAADEMHRLSLELTEFCNSTGRKMIAKISMEDARKAAAKLNALSENFFDDGVSPVEHNKELASRVKALLQLSDSEKT